jgi:hypothetical protein
MIATKKGTARLVPKTEAAGISETETVGSETTAIEAEMTATAIETNGVALTEVEIAMIAAAVETIILADGAAETEVLDEKETTTIVKVGTEKLGVAAAPDESHDVLEIIVADDRIVARENELTFKTYLKKDKRS